MIEVKIDQQEMQRILNVHRDQVPYAVARTLTDLANKAHEDIRANLPKQFIMRNKYVIQHIQTERANKKDWPKIKSEVGSLDDFMTIFEQGGVRNPPGKAFSIPKKIRNKITTILYKPKWPGSLLQGYTENKGRKLGSKNGVRSKDRKPFIATVRGKVGVFRRTGKFKNVGKYQTGTSKGKNRKRETIVMLWQLKKQPTHLKARPWLVKTTDEAVANNYYEFFKKNMEMAIGTKRPGQRV